MSMRRSSTSDDIPSAESLRYICCMAPLIPSDDDDDADTFGG